MANILERLFSKRIEAVAEEKARLIATNMTIGINDQMTRIQDALNLNQVELYNAIKTYTSTYRSVKDIDRYATSADIYAIVRLIAKTAARVPLFVYRVKDESAYKKYKQWVPGERGYTAEFMHGYKELHSKALEPVGDQDPLQALLDNPNDDDEKQEFYTAAYGFKLLTGNSFIYMPILPDGTNKGKVQGMYNMPSQNMVIVSVGNLPRIVVGYTLNLNEIRDFDKKEILHMRYWNPRWSGTGSEMIGMSPLEPLCKELGIMDAAGDNELSQFKHGGPPIILNNESISADEQSIAMVNKIASRWNKEKEGPENAGKWWLTAGKVNVHVVGQSPVDLNIIERNKVSLARVANAYSISDTLLNNNQASTESNIIEMQKALYTNAVLPEVYSLRDGLQKRLVPNYRSAKGKLVIDCDITGIPQLQPNYKDMADTFAALPIMTPNNILEAFKYGRDADPNMDKVYVKTGYQLLEDLSMAVEPLPDDTQNDLP